MVNFTLAPSPGANNGEWHQVHCHLTQITIQFNLPGNLCMLKLKLKLKLKYIFLLQKNEKNEILSLNRNDEVIPAITKDMTQFNSLYLYLYLYLGCGFITIFNDLMNTQPRNLTL
jgi:hypothetical protein